MPSQLQFIRSGCDFVRNKENWYWQFSTIAEVRARLEQLHASTPRIVLDDGGSDIVLGFAALTLAREEPCSNMRDNS